MHFEVTQYAIIPDTPDVITSTILQWTTSQQGRNRTIVPASGTAEPTRTIINDNTGETATEPVDLLLTTGGTGFGPRDYTPETILPLLHRPAPGIAQALLQEGLKHTPLAVLARPVAGTRHQTFIATLPGRYAIFLHNKNICAQYI